MKRTAPLCSGEFCAIAYYGFFSSGQRARLRQVAAWLKPPTAQPNLDKPEKNLTQRHKETKKKILCPFALKILVHHATISFGKVLRLFPDAAGKRKAEGRRKKAEKEQRIFFLLPSSFFLPP